MQKRIERAPVELSRGKHAMVMAGAALMIACVALSGTGLGLNLSVILTKFNATNLFGVATVLGVLAMTAANPLGASLSAAVGIRKTAFLDAAAMLMTSVLCALSAAWGVWAFLICRCLLSFATGMVTGSLYPIASYVYSSANSGKGYGIFTAAIALGGVVGGTVGGMLADQGLLVWSIVYPGVLTALGAIPVVLLFPAFRGAKRRTDAAGLLLLILVLLFLLFPLNFYRSFGWTHPAILGSMVLCALAAVVLYRYEKGIENPLIPFHLLWNPGFAAACLIGFFGTGIFTSLQSSYVPVLCQSVLGTTAMVSGLIPLPKTILTIILPTLFAGWLAKGRGRHWIMLTAQGAFILIPSLLLMVASRPETSYLFLMAMVGLTGIAESCKGAGLNNFAQSQLSMEDVPQGIALLNLLSTASTAVASAVFGMLLGTWAPLSQLPQTLKASLAPEGLRVLEQTGSYIGGGSAVAQIRAGLPEPLWLDFDASVLRIRESLGTAVGRMFLVCALCGSVVVIISMWVVRKNSNREARCQ